MRTSCLSVLQDLVESSTDRPAPALYLVFVSSRQRDSYVGATAVRAQTGIYRQSSLSDQTGIFVCKEAFSSLTTDLTCWEKYVFIVR